MTFVASLLSSILYLVPLDYFSSKHRLRFGAYGLVIDRDSRRYRVKSRKSIFKRTATNDEIFLIPGYASLESKTEDDAREHSSEWVPSREMPVAIG